MFQKNVPRGDPSRVRSIKVLRNYNILHKNLKNSDVHIHVVIVGSHRQVQLLNTIFDLGI